MIGRKLTRVTRSNVRGHAAVVGQPYRISKGLEFFGRLEATYLGQHWTATKGSVLPRTLEILAPRALSRPGSSRHTTNAITTHIWLYITF
jgi:hypothetical protein